MKKPVLIGMLAIAVLLGASYVLSESSDTGSITIAINTITTIDVGNTPMAFALDPGVADENGSSDIPFLLTNTGSTDIDVAICASTLAWSGSDDSNYYRYNTDNNEASSCSTIEILDWNDMNIVGSGNNKGDLCETFQNGGGNNQINVGIKIMSPNDEPDSSTPGSTVTFYIADDTTGSNDAKSGTC